MAEENASITTYLQKTSGIFAECFLPAHDFSFLTGFFTRWQSAHKKTLLDFTHNNYERLSPQLSNEFLKFRERSISTLIQCFSKEFRDLEKITHLKNCLASFLLHHDIIYKEILNSELNKTKNELTTVLNAKKVIQAYSYSTGQRGEIISW